MKKDFSRWHELKSKINDEYELPLFQEGELWWCSLGLNVGTEEDGKNYFFERPVMIFYKFSKDIFWGLPMTSREKYGKYNYSFSFRGKRRTVLLSQLRIMSGKRLIRRIGKISDHEFFSINEAVISLLVIKNGPPVGSSGA